MHAYFVARGIKHELDFTMKFLETTMLKWNPQKVLTKESQDLGVQFAVRPVQLYEFVFPEEHLERVMAMLNVKDGDKYGTWSFKTQAKLMRKMLGCEPFPTGVDYSKVSNIPFIPKHGVAFHPIGIKKDEKRIVDNNYYQEAL